MTFDEPLQPEWPKENVFVFDSAEDTADKIMEKIKLTEDPLTNYELNGNEYQTHTSQNHFNTKHYALLFAPGEYKDCRFEVGYYVQMVGLGKDAKGEEHSVRFTGSVNGKPSGPYVDALNKDLPQVPGGTICWPGSGLCLDTFWRSAENFSAEKTQWAVSQAAPIRRVYISDSLLFGGTKDDDDDFEDNGAYSSGGFLANAEVGNICSYGSNQQWFTRNVNFQGDVIGGTWSTVFNGCIGKVPEESTKVPESGPVHTVEPKPDVRVEKPFIVRNDDKNYELHVPKATSSNTVGPSLISGEDDVEIRSFSRVRVCRPFLPTDDDGNYVNYSDKEYNTITAEDERITTELQKALDDGKDLVLCPGVFRLTKPLIVSQPNQVILGLGLAALVAPQDGSPCIRVKANTEGVRIAGLMLEASCQVGDGGNSSGLNADGVRSLIDFGEPNVTDTGKPENPGLLSDIFTRVGGSNPDRRNVSTDVMVRIHSGNVVGDNLWLWRADHVKLAKGEEPNDPRFKLYHQTRIWDQVNNVMTQVNECVAKNAIEVRGDDVKISGLFCEHTTEHQCIWRGERGSVSFFQCELPYDVDSGFGDHGLTGYYIHDDVEEHTAKAVGVYTNFTCFDVQPRFAIKAPAKKGIIVENPFNFLLNGSGGIKHGVEFTNVEGMEQCNVLVGQPASNGKPSYFWIGKRPFASFMES